MLKFYKQLKFNLLNSLIIKHLHYESDHCIIFFIDFTYYKEYLCKVLSFAHAYSFLPINFYLMIRIIIYE